MKPFGEALIGLHAELPVSKYGSPAAQTRTPCTPVHIPYTLDAQTWTTISCRLICCCCYRLSGAPANMEH